MNLPSFIISGDGAERVKPRIYMLQIQDRFKPNNPPAWLLVERQETYRRDPKDSSIIYDATIKLYYKRILPKYAPSRSIGGGSFGGKYTKISNSVSLATSAVFLDLPDLQGQRIGTYLFNEIIMWAQRWPEATVDSINLLVGQSHVENKARRNRFYEQFGLVFDYADPEHREGLSRPMLVNALTPVDKWQENIEEHSTLDYLANVMYVEECATSELARCERAIKDLLSDLKKAEANPFRWALRIFWQRHGGAIMVGIVVTGMVTLTWLKFKI